MEIGQQPMTQSQETKISASTKLIIKLSSSAVSVILSDHIGNIIKYIHNDFVEKIEPKNLPEKLDLIFNKFKIDNSELINIKLIVCNKLSSLVPKNLFDEKLSLEYLKFNSKLLENDFAANDSIDEIEAVNVFLPYVNVNNYLIDRFGSFNYYHYSTVLIKKIIKYNSVKEISVYANIQSDYFQILILKNKNLIYFNSFDVNNKEDILYFLLFCFEQNKIDNIKTKLSLIGNIEFENNTYRLIEKFINNIEIIDFFQKEKTKVQNIKNYSEIDYLIL